VSCLWWCQLSSCEEEDGGWGDGKEEGERSDDVGSDHEWKQSSHRQKILHHSSH